jgi:PAS domain S-box-containing protein
MIKILLVDDELPLLEITKAFLESLKELEAETALSAKEALERIRITRYDAIVSDYQMPEMDGIEFLRLIRSSGDPTPFILFTGKGREEVVIEALNAGADFYLQKGGDPRSQFAELSDMIEKSVKRRRMEEVLIENEEKFKNIFNSANDAIYILDLKARFLEINDVGCIRLGYTKQEMLQKGMLDIDTERSAALIADHVKEVVETGHSIFEVEWRTKEGTVTPSEISAKRINYAGQPAILSVARDITERRRNEEILRDKEIKFSTVADFTYDWEYWLAPEGQIIYCSPSCKRVSGYTSEELSNNPDLLLEMVLPEDRHLLIEHYQRENEAEPSHFDFRIVTHDGVVRWIAHSCQAVFGDIGQYLGRRISNRDITDRKKAVEALTEERDKLSSLVNSINDEVWFADRQGKFVLANPSALREFGLDRLDSGIDVRQMTSNLEILTMDGKKRPVEESPPLRALKGEVVKNQEEMVRTPSTGELRYRQVSAAPVKDAKGNIIGSVSVARDVTDNFRREKQVQECETRFRELFNNIDSGIVVYEAASEGNDFVIRDFNSKAEKIEGVRKQDVIGKKVTEAFPGADAMGIIEVFRSVWKTGKQQTLKKAEYGEPNKPSTWRENVVFRLPNGEIVAVYRDVTEQKGMEDELRMSKNVFSESVAAMGMSDVSGTMTQVNDAFLRYLGYTSKEEVVGRPIVDFMVDRNETETIVKNLEQKGNWQGDYQARRKDGSSLSVHGVITMLKDDGGKPIGYHSTAIDVTDHKIGQEISPATNVKLNLLSNITVHDIQNQVVVLNGLVYKAKHANSPVQIKEYLSRIQQVADKIQSHIAFAREYQNLGKAPPSWIRLDTGIVDLASKFDSKWVQFEVDLGSLEVFSDAMLNRAFYNLIDDTLKHGQKATKVRFSAKPRGEDLLLVYEDNGVGVPIDRKKSIFERATSSQKVHGLVLVREILGITGMTIIENGEPGKGARFEIVIPKGNFRYPSNDQTRLK